MDAAQTIRAAIARVESLRVRAQDTPNLGAALHAVKRLQAQRFAGTYADLLTQGAYGAATRFFLNELYGAHDFAQRDAQFARIADALQTLSPSRWSLLRHTGPAACTHRGAGLRAGAGLDGAST